MQVNGLARDDAPGPVKLYCSTSSGRDALSVGVEEIFGHRGILQSIDLMLVVIADTSELMDLTIDRSNKVLECEVKLVFTGMDRSVLSLVHKAFHSEVLIVVGRLLVSWAANAGMAEHGVTEPRVAGCRMLRVLVLELLVGLMLRHDVHRSLVVVSQMSCMTDMRCHWVGARVMGTCQVLSGEVSTGLVRNVRNFRSSRVSWLMMHVSCKLVVVLQRGCM